MDEVGILTPALDLSSCRKGGKDVGRKEMGVMEGMRALAQPHRWSLLREALRKELDHHPHLADRLFSGRGAGMNRGQ